MIYFLRSVLSTIVCGFMFFSLGHCIIVRHSSLIYSDVSYYQSVTVVTIRLLFYNISNNYLFHKKTTAYFQRLVNIL